MGIINIIFNMFSVLNITAISAEQSSTQSGYSASNVLDGDASTFSYTGNEYNPWLSLNLPHTYVVDRVVVINIPYRL